MQLWSELFQNFNYLMLKGLQFRHASWHFLCLYPGVCTSNKNHNQMKNKRTILSSILCAIALALGSTAYATDLAIGDSRDLGLISPNHPADPTDSEGFIDILLAQPLGSGPTTIGANTYTRTNNDPLGGNYPAAVFAGELSFTPDAGGGNSATIDLGSNSYLYILGKYDGPNYGSEVWYGAGLSGVITLPEFGNGTQFGLSHVFVFNGTPVTTPDGGTTAALLGLALTGLAGLRARFGRN
jgi:VPDSG-CTERM motif